MCLPGTHDVVRGRLSRRSFFAASAAATASAAALALRPSRAASQTGRLVDLTHVARPDFPGYDPDWGIAFEQMTTFAENGFNLRKWTLYEHFATHLDAPIHFAEDAQTADEIPVEHLMCPLVRVDVAAKAAEDPDAMVTPDDLAAWEERNGTIPEGACVAMYSGWEDRLGEEGAFRNADDQGVMHFPGFHPEAAAMMIERNAIGMAVDTLSLDHGASQSFDTHYAWLPTNRWGLENVANLGGLPETGATIVVGAPKVEGATGGLTRAFALT